MLPPVPVVARERFDAVAATHMARVPAVDELSVGCPPLAAVELIHFARLHEHLPRPTLAPADLTAVEAFSSACARAGTVRAQLDLLAAPLQSDDLLAALTVRLNAIEEFSGGPLAAWLATRAEARELVDAADARHSGACSAWFGVLGRREPCRIPLAIDPVPLGTPWSLDTALHGFGPQPVAPRANGYLTEPLTRAGVRG